MMMNNTVSAIFETKEEFKAWRRGNKGLHDALEKIIFAWRFSSAKISAEPNRGMWAVYEHKEWMKKTGLSYDQVKRYFSALEKAGLIERERHRWGGSNNLTWVRPTAVALDFMSNRPHDKDRLGTATKAVQKAKTALPVAPPLALPDAPPLALSDYTTFPFLSNNTTNQQAGFSSSSEEGKGKAGENVKTGSTGNVVKLKFPVKPVIPAIEPEDEFKAIAAKQEAKKITKLQMQFPVIEGPHYPTVKHPAQFYSWSHFASWSEGKRAEKYARYKELITNWQGGKAAKALPAGDVSDEAWAKFQEWVNTPDDAAAG